MRGRLLATLLLAAAISCGGGALPGGPGFPGGPTPPPKGGKLAQSVTGTIGASGGSLSLTATTGETFTLTLPAGAVPADTSFNITEITNTAPGGLDSAFRIATPAGLQLAVAMTLSWTMPGSTTVDQVTAAYQDTSGYWFRVYSVTRDTAAQVLSVQTRFIGDWSLVTLATSRDLHGPFRLDSTESVPMTATGNVTLQWLGDDGGFAYYLPQGDITLATPLTRGSATCTPDTPATQTLPFSTAEIRNLPAPVQFRWGLNGRWDITCSDGYRTYVSTDFDSMGVTNVGCLESYLGGYTITNSHVQGQFLIDCTAKPSGYRIVASWDLVLPGATPGPLPAPPSPWP